MSDALTTFVGGFVDELVRSGVRHVCLAPGSRSTPLALLLKQHPGVRVWTHLDERSAAFFALGMAKSLREPVAMLSTSGTAAVNFAPAVVEAYFARVPLIVLTADRPPELRDVGSNQTIDQVRLFGSHVKWSIDMMLPETSPEALRYARAVACRAPAIARADAAGPVHINFPFREPLIPAADGLSSERNGTDIAEPAPFAQPVPFTKIEDVSRHPEPTSLAPLASELLRMERGLIICGPQDDHGFPEAVARLADELNVPILADALSQVRCGPHHGPLIIDAYDAFLRSDDISRSLAPQLLLRFGAAPTSKPLLLYLQRHAASRQVLIDSGDGWRDPALTADQQIRSDPRLFCEALSEALRSSEPTRPEREASDWTARWQEMNRNARAALTRRLEEEDGCSEPGVFGELASLLPAGTTLFAGNSMPVRDLDTFFGGSTLPLRFLANRGASGIDGVVSSALGASAVSSEPLVLVIGDLSFYHDMNGLLAAKRHDLNATIVLLNNDGGGIFSFLPQAEQSEHFEELFGTPHGLDFRHAAEMYGLAYRRVEGPDQFRASVRESIGAPGVHLIEVRTDRRANALLHEKLWEAASSAARAPITS
ncbi:MAG: 2-succinyl-5-enolpyruvyl-6-hydroxy-3-cyclohexene-1-carboxylic-acid synthase [Chloroflexi bacterium]|nr:2-succinyl-5-enolpyruvyl-6-hydroxy-3-cyclohexene-1-carboxylic-acid synthase [Chloroflexota bacterium]